MPHSFLWNNSQNDKHLAPSPTQSNCSLKVVAPDVAAFAAAIIIIPLISSCCVGILN